MSLLWPCGCYLHRVSVERDPMARDMMLPIGMLHAPLVVNYLHNLVRVTVLFISGLFLSLCVCAVSFELACENIWLCFFLVIKTFSCWGACCWNTVLQRFRQQRLLLLFLLYAAPLNPRIGCKTNSFTWSNVWASLFYSSFPEYLAMFMVRLLVLVLRQPSTCLFFNCFDIPLEQDQLFMFLCYARGL